MTLVRVATVLFILLSVSASSGCRKKNPAASPPTPTALDIGEVFFERGEYREAAKAYEIYLRDSAPRQRDHVLYRLALSYLAIDNPEDHWDVARSRLQQLVADFAGGPLTAEARVLLSFMDTVERLRQERQGLIQKAENLSSQLAEARYVAPPSRFETAESLLRQGAGSEAAAHYRAYLESEPAGEHYDEALFRLAMLYLVGRKGTDQWDEGIRLLNRLVQQHSDSPFRSQAESVLDLVKQISSLRGDLQAREQRLQELTKELEALKAIDLRRRPRR